MDSFGAHRRFDQRIVWFVCSMGSADLCSLRALLAVPSQMGISLVGEANWLLGTRNTQHYANDTDVFHCSGLCVLHRCHWCSSYLRCVLLRIEPNDCVTILLSGGFLAGLIIPHENGFAISLVEKLEDLVCIIFMPIVCSDVQHHIQDINCLASTLHYLA